MDEILDSRIKFLQFDDWTELIFIIGNPAKPSRFFLPYIPFVCPKTSVLLVDQICENDIKSIRRLKSDRKNLCAAGRTNF